MIVKTPDQPVADFHAEQAVSRQTALHKVLHVINGEHFSGAERVQDLLAIALSELGYCVDFACLKTGRFSDVRKSRTRIFDLRMRNSVDLLVVRKLVRIVREHDYQLLHAHTPRSLMISSLAAWWVGVPLVYHVHSPVGRDSTRTFRNRINTRVETRCLNAADAMICVSSSLADYMRQIGHESSKIHVVCNGVPACCNLPERGSPGNCWILGTMALFRPRKGIETLLQALALLRAQEVNVHLRAVGGFETPEYEAEVRKLAADLQLEDRITWTGFQTDIESQLQQMDLFILPSLFGEGLPMVVLEAMAHGVPVIASNVEGIPEAIRDNQDGLIFEAGSAESLCEKVEQLYGDASRWSEMRASALQRQRDRLSEASMAGGVANVYRQIRPLD